MKKPIVFFDLETTGLEIVNDRIIEICMVKLNPDGTRDKYYSLVNPQGKSISEGAFERHGIAMEKLASFPTFNEIAKDIVAFLEGCDIGGYNVVKFDLPFLMQELLRAKVPFNHRSAKLVDPLLMYQKMEPRDLSSAYKRFTGKVLEDAHSAEADINATIDVFQAQVKMWNLSDDAADIQDIILEDRDKWIDLAGKFKYTDDGQIVFTFGKYSGKLVSEICAVAPDYLDWMGGATSTFPEETKLIAKRLVQKFSISA